MATAGSKEARELEKVKRSFDKAYKEVYKATDQGKVTSLTAEAESGTKFSRNKGKHITYENLISKPDMEIVNLGNTQVSDLSRKQIINKARENIKKFGKTDSLGRNVIFAKDVKSNIVVGADPIRHGFTRDFETNAKIALHIGEYLQNSIKVNEIKPRRDNAVGGYILLSYGKDSKGNHYPAYFVVETLTTGESELVEFDSLSSMNGKKIEEAIGGANQGFQSLTSSKISISDLLDIVNVEHSDILPHTVAEHYGNERRKTKLGENVKFSLSDSTGRKLTKEQAKHFKDSKARDDNGNLQVVYHGTNKERNNFELAYKKDRTTLSPGVQFPDISNSVNDSISENKIKSNTFFGKPRTCVYNESVRWYNNLTTTTCERPDYRNRTRRNKATNESRQNKKVKKQVNQ